MDYKNYLEIFAAIFLLIIIILLIFIAKIIEDKKIFKLENERSKTSFDSQEKYYNIVVSNINNVLAETKRENEKQKRIISFLSDQNIILHDEAEKIPEKFKSEVLRNEKVRKAHEHFLIVLQTSK